MGGVSVLSVKKYFQKIGYYLRYLVNPVIIGVLIFELFIVFLINYLEPFKSSDLQQKLNFCFTSNVVLFAIIEGASTYLQVSQSKKRNQIDDKRNELEKAHGLLYSILAKYNPEDFLAIPINGESISCIGISKSDRYKIDQILSVFPFMFKNDIFKDWQKIIADYPEDVIPLDFANKLHSEYHRKVNEYYELFK